MKKHDTKRAPTITVAFCQNKFDKRVKHREMPFPEFWRLFKDEPAVRRDKNGPGITLGRFDRDAWKAAAGKPIPKADGGKGTGWLLNEYCLSSTGYLADLDNTTGSPMLSMDEMCSALDDIGCAYAAYTTHSHTRFWPKLRFVIPFADPIKGTPEQIAGAYGRVHDYFNTRIYQMLDSRRSPAFMAHLPAVHPHRRDDYERVVRRSRPLADVSDAFRASEPTKADGVLDFPPEAELPEIQAEAFRMTDWMLDTIVKGPQERNADRSRACASVYVALDHAGATPAEIAAILWDPANGISERWHEPGRGYHALCHDIARVLGKTP